MVTHVPDSLELVEECLTAGRAIFRIDDRDMLPVCGTHSTKCTYIISTISFADYIIHAVFSISRCVCCLEKCGLEKCGRSLCSIRHATLHRITFF